MKTKQKNVTYTPITIELETQEEALAFFSILGKVGKFKHNFYLTEEEAEVLRSLTAALNTGRVTIN